MITSRATTAPAAAMIRPLLDGCCEVGNVGSCGRGCSTAGGGGGAHTTGSWATGAVAGGGGGGGGGGRFDGCFADVGPKGAGVAAMGPVIANGETTKPAAIVGT